MSGPIVRKYGFPNFEKIFGERELKHGAEGETETSKVPVEASKPTEGSNPPKADSEVAKP